MWRDHIQLCCLSRISPVDSNNVQMTFYLIIAKERAIHVGGNCILLLMAHIEKEKAKIRLCHSDPKWVKEFPIRTSSHVSIP